MNKKAHQSKKWLAFFFTELLLAGLLGYALKTQPFGWPMAGFMSIGVAGMTTLAIGLILKQAMYDKWVAGISAIGGRDGD